MTNLLTQSQYVKVPAPPLSPPSISLLTSSSVIDITDARWFAGVTYFPEGIGAAQAIKLDASSKTPVTGPSADEWDAHGIVASDRASTFGFEEHDYRARATRQLMAHESRIIEAQLWSDGLSLGNTKITGGTDWTTSVTVAKAIATMEQGIVDAGHGGSPLLFHMRPYLFDLIVEANPTTIRREGNKWYTAMDNILVPGRGYNGKGPSGQAVGATEWLYCTPLVEVRRGPITTLPGNMAEATDRTTNTVTFFAERAVLASFDTKGVRLALEVTT